MMRDHALSERRVCGLTRLSRSTKRYRNRRSDQSELRCRLRELAAQQPRFGYRRLWVLLRREGHLVNHKRVQRLYRLEGLLVRRKKTKAFGRNPAPSARASHKTRSALVHGFYQ